MAEIISVLELNTRIKNLFAGSELVNDVWVGGEISDLKKYPSGHYYFVLKDATSEIRAVLFSQARARIDFEPQDNMKIVAFGNMGVYLQRGNCQFVVSAMKKAGVGDRYLAFEALKKKLGEEGLFDKERKRELPRYPRTIGVVTSQSGAVIHDIITTSASRYTADIILAPAMVQGDGAANTIVAGIGLLNRYGVDVIIVGRGGGSIEDLWPFNEESVARAIAASKAPVVSAVGHETDFTIADFVADVRAPTPTGAAAIILRDKGEIRSELNGFGRRINRAMASILDSMWSTFKIVDSKLDPSKAMDLLENCSMKVSMCSRSMDVELANKIHDMRSEFEAMDMKLKPQRGLENIVSMRERLDSMLVKIDAKASSAVENGRIRMDFICDRPESMIKGIIAEAKDEEEHASKHLEDLNPMNVLTRGYSMILSDKGEVITSVGGMSVGDNVTIRLRDGSASADITKKETKE